MKYTKHVMLKKKEEKKEKKNYEEYTFNPNKTLVANLFIGETYIEPFGTAIVTCHDNGFSAEVDYK